MNVSHIELDRVTVTEYRDFIVERLTGYYTHLDALSRAALGSIEARKMVFTALYFTSDPAWKVNLKRVLDVHNSETATAIHRARYLATAAFPDDPDVRGMFARRCEAVEHEIMALSSALNDAVTVAIAEDNLTPLRTIAAQENGALLRLLDENRAIVTEGIAQDRHFDRAGVYIGTRALQLEESGVKRSREQWRRIFAELQQDQHLHTADQSAAWEYLKYKNPHGMTADERRYFEQDLSRLKKNARELTTKIRQNGGENLS